MSWAAVALTDAYWFQEGPGLRKWQFTSEGIKVLNVGNIMPDGSIDLSRTDRHISLQEFEKKYSHFGVDEGDLVIASSGISFDEDGFLRTKVAFVEDGHLPLCMNTSTIRFKAMDGKSDLRFLRHWFQSLEFRRQVSQRVTGSAQQNFGPSHLKTMTIALPPLDEQKRIAAILDQANELCRKRQRAIECINQLGQAIFHEMFGDPATNPKGFEALPLGDAVEFIGGSQPAKSHFLYEDGPDRVRFVQIRDFRTDKYPTWVPKALAKRPFTEDDVMIGRYGPPVFQIFRGLSGTYNVALMKAKPKLHLTSDFVFYLLQEPKLHSFVVANSERTAGQSGVNLDLLEKYPAYAPPAALLREFSDRIADVDSQARAYREASMAAERLFASLQHRAFRGEL